MQASQSRTASNLLAPDLDSDPSLDSTYTRSLSSPFSAPILAARRYFERQRGDAPQSAAWPREQAPPVENQSREHLRREQDRRLERSLYEGHSIEAGSGLAALRTGGADGAAEAEPAYLTEQDGPELLFSSTSAAPLPDPDAVRGAIQRLTREAGARREPARSFAHLSPEAAATSSKLPEVEPLNFADVARRVWDAHASGASYAQPGAQVRDAGLPAASALMTATGESEISEAKADAQDESPVEVMAASPNPVIEDAVIPVAAIGDAKASAGRPAAQLLRAPGEAPALAHDACNLLSALALYSELLASPGVLGEQHRHYAEELRLMAGRSQILIDRLQRNAMTGCEKASAFAEEEEREAVPETGNSVSRDPASGQLIFSQVPSSWAADKGGPDQVTADPAPDCAAGIETEQTSLVDLLRRWGGLLSTLAEGRLEVVFGSQAATPVPAGAEALERILVNLVRNARAATAGGGAIRIGVGAAGSRTAQEGAYAAAGLDRTRVSAAREASESAAEVRPASERLDTMVLTVDDSGCGMTEAQIRGILGTAGAAHGPSLLRAPAGEMVSNESRRTLDDGSLDNRSPDEGWLEGGHDSPANGLKGTSQTDGRTALGRDRAHGLGLQIVRSLVAASGGSLAIQSWPGRGTRVEIRWPVAIQTHQEMPVTQTPVVQRQAWLDSAAYDAADTVLTTPIMAPPLRAAQVPSTIAGAAINLGQTPVSGPFLDRSMDAEIDLVSEPVTTPILEERAKDSVGPDGFSEAELRAMMLRLHRNGPQERAVPAKGLTDWRTPLERQPRETQLRGRPFDLRGTDGGFGGPGSGALGSGAHCAAGNDSAQPDRAAKGAIAC